MGIFRRERAFLVFAVVAATGAAQAAPEPAENLAMGTAIAKAMRNNPTLVARRLQQELNEITYDEAWRRMWLPSVTVGATSGTAYTLAQVPGSAVASNPGSRAHGNPSSGVGLSVGQYNLYNFGRDRDTLKSAELEVDRSRESMHETERGVRFQVIQTVFNFKTRQDLLDVAQRSVESCESVLSLVRGRKSSRADVASAEIDLLNARNILIQSQTAYSQALWDLNLVLGDPIGHPYRVKSEVKFIKFRMTLDDVLSVYRQNAPAIHDARKTYEQRQAELRIAEKNALPLPVLQFSGFNFGYNFTSVGTFPNRDPGNVNFSLGLALSIPIIGDGGFLFQRALRQAEVRVEAAEVDLRNAANVNEVRARGLYTTLLQLEYAVDLNQRIFKQSSDVFEASLSALQNRSLYNRLDLKNALEQLRTAELALTSSVLDHYNAKLELANLIGVDRFPEENL